jgi:hypothetical protein
MNRCPVSLSVSSAPGIFHVQAHLVGDEPKAEEAAGPRGALEDLGLQRFGEGRRGNRRDSQLGGIGEGGVHFKNVDSMVTENAGRPP